MRWWVLALLVAACGSGNTTARNDAGRGPGAADGSAGVGGDAASGMDGAGAGGAADGGGDARAGADALAPADATVSACAGGLCADFPATPVFVNVPATVAGMFSGTPAIGGSRPCITEPQDATMFPNDWLRPRVKFSGTAGQVVQIRMTADNQANELVAYTMDDAWALPADIWANLRLHQVDDPVTVTVWVQGGAASAVRFTTAPVAAGGGIVFFSANGSLAGISPTTCYTDIALCSAASELRGFTPGDESTITALTVASVKQPSRRADSGNAAPVVCVGCHAGTPDDAFVSVVDHYAWRAAVAAVNESSVGALYPTLTAGGLQALQQPGWGRFTYTRGAGAADFWQTGRKIAVASLGLRDPLQPDWSNAPDQNDSPHLAWMNLEAPNPHTPQSGDAINWAYVSYAANAGVDSGNALGFIARTGDPYGAATPSWSHDGATIAYASTNASVSGRLNMEAASTLPNDQDPAHNATAQPANAARASGLTNIYTVPFNRGLGGVATPLAGAATTAYEEYYPEHSPDDRLIAFTRVPAGQVMYINPNAELALVPASGGAAVRLQANDPPACSGKVSPGVNNNWAKWAPQATTVGGATYYWVVFASTRAGLPPVTAPDGHTVQMSQIYIAPLVVTEVGVTTYPAIYAWNQPVDRVNTTPDWETFDLPAPP
jgi:hypothetical protein